MKTKLLVALFSIYLIANLSVHFASAQNTWVQKPFFGGGNRNGASGFSIGSKGYVGLGWSDTSLMKDFWAYDTVTNAWSQIADFGGSPRDKAVGFSIGNKGYIGTGLDTCSVCPAMRKDFWEYNSATNSWTQKADFGGTGRYSAVGFSIGGKGYIGTGHDGAKQNDFWQYDTTTNTWTQKAFLVGLERYGAVGFSIGNKGYIGGGYIITGQTNDFWEYNPAADVWTQKANLLAGSGTNYNSGFAIGSRGYVLTYLSGAGSDLEAYTPATNTWILAANLSQARFLAVGFSIGNSGYITTGQDGSGRRKDLWKYSPCASANAATITASGPTTFCQGGDVTLTANAGNSYVWWTNETTQSIIVYTSGTVAVMVTDSCGTATSSPITITVSSFPTVSVSSSDITICAGNCSSLSAIGGVTYLWNPSGQTTSSITVCPTITTTYTVIGSNSTGCTDTAMTTITVLPVPVISVSNTTICQGQSATICASGGIFYNWNTGATTACISVAPTATTSYSITVADSTGCTSSDSVTVTIDNLNVNLVLVPDTANPLVWYGYPAITGGSPITYYWDFGDGNNSSIAYPTHTYSVVGNYIICLTVTDANGCSSSSCDTTYKIATSASIQTFITIDPLTTGIESLKNTFDISIYPNPSNGIFTIKSSEKISSIEITNVLGAKVYSLSPSGGGAGGGLIINLSSQPSGIYFLKVNSEKGNTVKKIIKD